jgi:hypothetical protein
MRLSPKIKALAATAAATAVAVVATSAGVAQAAGVNGYDVSWPQCGRSLPVDGDFRIVGVNGGKPYEGNPCLAEQFRWAQASAGSAFYMNTANPGPASKVLDWYAQKTPNASCSRSDEAACAYNYGYNAAKHAFGLAQRETGAAGQHSWWLDVETANSWSANRGLNAADIVGSIAYLRTQGVPVGVYSTEYQWGRITNGARLADVPNWLAGARDADQAARWCAPDSSFTGGPVILVQWVQDDLDHNHACAALPAVTGTPQSGASGLELVVQDLLSLDLPKLLRDLGVPPS